jgi:Fur family ferric uptake transcriptional regulator
MKPMDLKLDPQKVFRELLESKGFKYTQQRKEILDYLLESKKHVTPEELYRQLNRKDPSLGRATVFRTLHLLEEAGFVNTIQFASGRKAYEHKFARPHHDHLICVDCSEVIEFSNETIERIQDRITAKFHFEPLWHQHQIFGKCEKCQKVRK